MVSPQNGLEALAFLISALTAGFVEEFVFRGYIQKQFTAGHICQGWARLIPVFLIGAVLMVVALCRKSLVPGMIAHGLRDGLVAFGYFAKHL